MGFDPSPRSPMELPAYYKSSKDGQFLCKAHANQGCKYCCELPFRVRDSASLFLLPSDPLDRYAGNTKLISVGWKKMITKLHKEGKKASKNKKESTSNF